MPELLLITDLPRVGTESIEVRAVNKRGRANPRVIPSIAATLVVLGFAIAACYTPAGAKGEQSMATSAATREPISEDQAIAAAREFVPEESATVSATMMGSFSTVFGALASRPAYLPQPELDGKGEAIVWGVQFKLRLDLCGPEGTKCEVRDGFRTVFLDSYSGAWLRTSTFAPNPESKAEAP